MEPDKRVKLATRRGSIKRLHVDRHIMAANRKHNLDEPALTIQTSAGSLKVRRVKISGPSTLVHSRKPLSCGARAWVETKSELIIEEWV